MKVEATTEIPEVKVIEPRVFTDDRGFFLETYRRETLAEAGIECELVQDNHSFSHRGVLRGLHYQVGQEQDKLVRVATGRVLDVAVDLRRGSATFGRHVAVELSGDNHRQLFIPAGFAHGFYALEESHLLYKCSAYYAPACERGVVWNDPDLAIPWPADPQRVSDKDRALPKLAELSPDDLPVL